MAHVAFIDSTIPTFVTTDCMFYVRFVFVYLQCVQNALDDAGIPIDEIPKNTGVYSGIGLMDHAVAMCNEAKAMNPYTCTGLSHCVAPNRVSFFYDINGPSYSVDTACAASLTAIHLACMALWNKKCTMAIPGP